MSMLYCAEGVLAHDSFRSFRLILSLFQSLKPNWAEAPLHYPPAPLGATRPRGPGSHVLAQFLSAAVVSAIAAVLSAAVSNSNSSSPLSIAVLLATAKDSSLPLPPSRTPPPKAPNHPRSPHRPVFPQPWVAPAGSQPGVSVPTGFWLCFWLVFGSILDPESLPK